jgi:vesicle transport protein SEC22|mmetsp:Transcript_39518/g.62755  ORF Transcript_39518/g.62755 Transcript_39518/m.62755 type:complete len:239 (-) Transcript_39518:105-821(-)
MAHVTYIARQQDGLILVESWDQQNVVPQNVKQQAKMLLKKINSQQPTGIVEVGGNYNFHYATREGVCYLALFDRGYPKNLAFRFLEDIRQAFGEELKREFGSSGAVDYRSHIETIEKPYFFVKFDRVILKKKKEFQDPTSTKALDRLNDNLAEVSNVMRTNIEELLNRGENLEAVSDKASSLRSASKDFKDQARMLSFMTALQKYAVPAVLGLVVVLVIWFKFFSGSSSSSSELSPPA